MKNHFDQSALERLEKIGGKKLRGQIIALFLERTPAKIAEAQAGLADGNLTVVERAVHSLKSSAGNVGAVSIQELAQRVESLAEAGQAEIITDLLEELSGLFTLIKPLLERAPADDR
ncbi:MAG: Hpt domain-containing protein [Candidatus Neomarinimicrobiota bacterium]